MTVSERTVFETAVKTCVSFQDKLSLPFLDFRKHLSAFKWAKSESKKAIIDAQNTGLVPTGSNLCRCNLLVRA